MEQIFNDTQVACSLQSDVELKKSLFLFRTMKYPFLVKIGAALTQLSLKLQLPVQGIIKRTIFKQFCGGVTEADCMEVVRKIQSLNVKAVLDYSVEGKERETDFNMAVEKKCSLISFASQHSSIAFAVVKPTAIGRFALWQLVSEGKTLNEVQMAEWERVGNRFEKICEQAHHYHIPLLIDAEESWMQDAADELAKRLMMKYNREEALIYNTVQCYRHDRLAYLTGLHEEAKKAGYKIGVKLVRGAYMEKERKRARRKGYPDPICIDKKATDAMFNSTLTYAIEHISDISLFVGSHNEESAYLAMRLMEKKALTRDDKRVWFGQLYGMSNHLSFNLAKAGYNVVKLLPFGPVKEVIPYLIRRAQENTSVAGQTGRELSLIKQELKRRKL